MAYRFLSLVAFLGVASLTACTSAPSEDFDLSGGNKDGGMRCTPGDTQECICVGGGMGTQTCRASGSSFGTCTGCSSSTDGPVGVVTDMGGSACGDCDGCCDGNTCVPFANETTAKCGTRGQNCAMCTGGKVCSMTNGSCVDNSGGCMNCPYGVTCSGGACTTNIDPNAYFKFYVKSIKMKAEFEGDSWDGFVDDDPEPQACVYYQSMGTIYKGCSDYSTVDNNNGIDATFDASKGLATAGGVPFLVPASALIGGTLHVVAQDNDSPLSPDVVADIAYPATTTLKASYSTGASGSLIEMVFELK